VYVCTRKKKRGCNEHSILFKGPPNWWEKKKMLNNMSSTYFKIIGMGLYMSSKAARWGGEHSIIKDKLILEFAPTF
jgi:hypothetical protein